MSASKENTINVEQVARLRSGWPFLVLHIAAILLFIASAITSIVFLEGNEIRPVAGVPWLLLSLLGIPATAVSCVGFFTLQPNQARVLVLFGSYKGTERRSGFFWGNPFYANGKSVESGSGGEEKGVHRKRSATSRNKVSLRTRNFTCDKIKVNDLRGNPIEIAAVVVWRVLDTAQAMFDVDDYQEYVHIQSESALRQIASHYPYDHGGEDVDDEITLRSNPEEVSAALKNELHERLAKAGVEVEEARLMHLAYAPEIASAMLRRQQAEAVIAARRKIVDGAVGMVKMAVTGLSENGVLELDDDRRAAMASNLMVVLCGDHDVRPVINAGTLYS